MGKKPKLTKEQKEAQKAAKMAAAELQKKMDRMEHLEREMELAEKSWKKLKGQFKEMLLKMQMPSIKHDIEVLWHSYDSALDRKDYVIEKLLSELEERELLRRQCFAEHDIAISKLIVLKEKRVKEGEMEYYVQRDEKFVEHEVRTIKKKDERTDNRIKFNLVTNAMSARTEEAMMNLRSDYVQRLDDERDKNNDARKLLKGLLENRMDSSWRQLRKSLADYEASAEERRKRLDVLAAEDERSTSILERQERRVKELQTMEEQLRWRLTHEEPAQMLRGRMAEQRYFSVAFGALRHRLEVDRRHDTRQLFRLSSVSNETIEKLRRLVKKGERLLSIALGCTSLETLEERVQPVPRATTRCDDLAPVGALAFARSMMHPASRHVLDAGDNDDDADVDGEADAEGEGEADADDETPSKSSELSGASSKTITSSTGYESGAGGGEGSLGGEMGALMAGFWRRAARADAAKADVLATLNDLRFEQAALKRALRCCLRQVDALRPRHVDRRRCEDACYGNTMEESSYPSPPDCRNVVEASHVYKYLPC